MEARRKQRRHTQRDGEQLRLIPGAPWSLDPKTRALGLAGVAQARRALEAAPPPEEPLRRAS